MHISTFEFLCGKVLLAFLLNGKVVIMPYLSSEANSSVMPSFKLIGVGRV